MILKLVFRKYGWMSAACAAQMFLMLKRAGSGSSLISSYPIQSKGKGSNQPLVCTMTASEATPTSFASLPNPVLWLRLLMVR